MTPTQRALRDIRQLGYIAAVVERWNQFAQIRQDLFGFADIIAFNHDETLLLQVTSGSNHAKRVTKIKASDEAEMWAHSEGRRVEVWSYSKRKVKRGGVAIRWTLRREEMWPK